jgi:phosphoribosyl-ATP pyrophosphohydrolase
MKVYDGNFWSIWKAPWPTPHMGIAVHHESSVLEQLMAVIRDRKANPPARSYTTTLMNGGVEKIGEKILEEAREVVEAAGQTAADGHQHLVYESADLIYHLCVLLGFRDVSWPEVEQELGRRFGICGLDEKESRQ